VKKITIEVPDNECNTCPYFSTWVPYEVGMCFRKYYCKRFKIYLKSDPSVPVFNERDNYDGPEHIARPCRKCK
jgi:hypothetical protein